MMGSAQVFPVLRAFNEAVEVVHVEEDAATKAVGRPQRWYGTLGIGVPEMKKAHVHIGTSGWSYPERDTGWRGVFYPGKGDELEFYSRYFDTVEVNSTFYHPATRKMADSWVRRTPKGFKFSVKLWQKFTHPKMFEEATGAKPAVDSEDFNAFRQGFDPIAEAGKLGCLLLQFPPSFHATEQCMEGLERYLSQFRDYPLAVELRHKSWGEKSGELKDLFASLDVSWVFIDEPKFSSSIEQKLEPAGSTLYVRFHGRNKAKWWTHDEAWERYDYLYKAQELLPFAEEFQRLITEGLVKRLYIYFNNHAKAQAVANALMLKYQLGLPIEAEVPASLLDTYPDLSDLVGKTAPSALRSPAPPEREGRLPL